MASSTTRTKSPRKRDEQPNKVARAQLQQPQRPLRNEKMAFPRCPGIVKCGSDRATRRRVPL